MTLHQEDYRKRTRLARQGICANSSSLSESRINRITLISRIGKCAGGGCFCVIQKSVAIRDSDKLAEFGEVEKHRAQVPAELLPVPAGGDFAEAGDPVAVELQDAGVDAVAREEA